MKLQIRLKRCPGAKCNLVKVEFAEDDKEWELMHEGDLPNGTVTSITLPDRYKRE